MIVDRFKSWRLDDYKTPYENIPEFCYSAPRTEIIEKEYSLVPSRYIELLQTEDIIDFDVNMSRLQIELKELMTLEQETRKDLIKVMRDLGYEIDL